ncbi:MAG TPA: phytanoyl-CoA dioxygenase family protein [Abditibacteriaceae bacterium]|jgi:ectoine hydroxylase-related dioxygenase (phytanoyl-CoA dioxygenase family)
MSIAWNEDSIPGRHTISYRVRDSHKGFPSRDVEVLATPQEIEALTCDGYLVRESLLSMSEVERLRAALDETVSRDARLETSGGRSFGGVFIRHLMDKHEAFLDFLKFEPTLSIARAVLGPYVQVRGFTGRVCFPDAPNQETEWHFHQRLICDPLPPFFMRPQALDVLLYMDDITDLNGPLSVVPGSHQWTEQDLPRDQFDDLPGQMTLRLRAGSLVICHGSLWHRALPTRPGGTIRRLLLLGYGPGWLKPSVYGEKPQNGLTTQLLQGADEETRELLGHAGFM